jgi:predicted hydrocarbon binding protein
MTNIKEKFSGVEVSGDAIISVTRGVESEALCRILLEKYDLEDVQKGQYYSLGNYLALLEEIERRMPSVLRRIGEAMCDEVILPPSITTFEEFAVLHDKIYNMNIRGHSSEQVGGYFYKKQMDGSYLATVSTPFSCSFTQALIAGFAKKFGTFISIEHSDDKCRTRGDKHCSYRLQDTKVKNR